MQKLKRHFYSIKNLPPALPYRYLPLKFDELAKLNYLSLKPTNIQNNSYIYSLTSDTSILIFVRVWPLGRAFNKNRRL